MSYIMISSIQAMLEWMPRFNPKKNFQSVAPHQQDVFTLKSNTQLATQYLISIILIIRAKILLGFLLWSRYLMAY